MEKSSGPSETSVYTILTFTASVYLLVYLVYLVVLSSLSLRVRISSVFVARRGCCHYVYGEVFPPGYHEVSEEVDFEVVCNHTPSAFHRVRP